MTLRHFTGTTMADAQLQKTIEDAWEARAGISTTTTGAVREAVETALELLDSGKARVAERGTDGTWTVNQWLKKAVLLSFRLNDNIVIQGPGGTNWWDKVPSKFEGWGENPWASTRPTSTSRPTTRSVWHHLPRLGAAAFPQCAV